MPKNTTPTWLQLKRKCIHSLSMFWNCQLGGKCDSCFHAEFQPGTWRTVFQSLANLVQGAKSQSEGWRCAYSTLSETCCKLGKVKINLYRRGMYFRLFFSFGFLASWLLGFLASWLLGFLASWLLGFLASWLFAFLASWLLGFLASWLLGFLASWLLGFLASWLLGFLASWLLGFLASWLLGFAASWLLGFLASRLFGFLSSRLQGFWAFRLLLVYAVFGGFGFSHPSGFLDLLPASSASPPPYLNDHLDIMRGTPPPTHPLLCRLFAE